MRKFFQCGLLAFTAIVLVACGSAKFEGTYQLKNTEDTLAGVTGGLPGTARLQGAKIDSANIILKISDKTAVLEMNVEMEDDTESGTGEFNRRDTGTINTENETILFEHIGKVNYSLSGREVTLSSDTTDSNLIFRK